MKMKKTYIFALVATALITALSACSNIDYNGEYSKDGYYNTNNQVYFYYKTAADSIINYSFSGKPDDTLTHTVYVPVRLAGKLIDKAQTFKVAVNGASTAKSGEHYSALAPEYSIPAGAMQAYLPIKLIRKNLSEEKNDSIKLILNLIPTNDLGTRFSKNNKVTITFDNVLMRPDYWDVLELWGIGTYSRAKHKMLLGFYNGDVKGIYDGVTNNPPEALYKLYGYVVKIKEYFDAHPEKQ